MAYTNAWNESLPSGTAPGSRALVDDYLRQMKLDIRERMNEIVVDWTADPVVVKPTLTGGGLGTPVLITPGGIASARTAAINLNLGTVFDCGTIDFSSGYCSFTLTFTNRQVGYSRLVYVVFKLTAADEVPSLHINAPDVDWALFQAEGVGTTEVVMLVPGVAESAIVRRFVPVLILGS